MANQIPFTLWDHIEARGIPYAHNSSDLYLPYSEEVREILNDFPKQKSIARQFINQTNNEVWLDVPFAYLPWWENKQNLIK